MNNILHIYGQYEEHDDIEIAGDRQALIELRAAIDTALDTKNGESESYTNDGEDYTIHVTTGFDGIWCAGETIELYVNDAGNLLDIDPDQRS